MEKEDDHRQTVDVLRSQAATNTAASTDCVIDLGPIDGNRRDIGVGYPLSFGCC